MTLAEDLPAMIANQNKRAWRHSWLQPLSYNPKSAVRNPTNEISFLSVTSWLFLSTSSLQHFFREISENVTARILSSGYFLLLESKTGRMLDCDYTSLLPLFSALFL